MPRRFLYTATRMQAGVMAGLLCLSPLIDDYARFRCFAASITAIAVII